MCEDLGVVIGFSSRVDDMVEVAPGVLVPALEGSYDFGAAEANFAWAERINVFLGGSGAPVLRSKPVLMIVKRLPMAGTIKAIPWSSVVTAIDITLSVEGIGSTWAVGKGASAPRWNDND